LDSLTHQESSQQGDEEGGMNAVFTQDSNFANRKDNQPAVYMANNCCCFSVELPGQCQGYSKKDKAYIAVPQPSLNQLFSTFMGGVNLLDSSTYKEICHLHKSVQVVMVPV
jgi:hypothetical protein